MLAGRLTGRTSLRNFTTTFGNRGGGDEDETEAVMTTEGIDKKVLDRRTVSVGESAVWDARLGVFCVKVQGNKDVGSITILRSSPLPISHLDSAAPARKTKLGTFLRSRLEIEVNAAIQRGEREVADSMTLLTREESEQL
jgi:hypothetical protein